MLIADGEHLPTDALRAFIKCKGFDKVVATSDVSPVAGLEDGTHEAFGGVVRVEGTRVRTADGSCLAGSGSLLADCMDHLAGLGYDEAALLRMGFWNPLAVLGLDASALAPGPPRVAIGGGRVRVLP